MHCCSPIAFLALCASVFMTDMRTLPAPGVMLSPPVLAQGASPPLSLTKRWRSPSLDPAPNMTGKP